MTGKKRAILPIEVICGPMYSGKSEELVRRLRRAEIARLKVVAFKPSIDDRWPGDIIKTHSGHEIPCLVREYSADLFNVGKEYDVIGVDEAQFYDDAIYTLVRSLSSMDKTVIIAGLDMTYRAEPFGMMPYLMAVAEKLDKITAICHVCGAEATRTQRLIDESPAPFSGPTVLVGASEAYEARCSRCFEAG
jgi:thymidine kinase